MAQPPPFVLPPGVILRFTEEGLHLGYDGDIELHESPEPGFAVIEASGDLEVRLPRVTGNLRAGGTLRIRGEVAGGRLHGQHVVLGRHRVDCRSISASESITIGAAQVTADAIIAPVIHLDPKAWGRVTVIESRNERGATKIKGGFSVADYHDMFGNADEFLAARGLARLGPSPAATTPRHHQRHQRQVPSLPMDEVDEFEDTGPSPGLPSAPPPPSRPLVHYDTSPTPRPPPTASPPPPPASYGMPAAHPPTAPPPPRRVEEEEDDPSLSVSLGALEPMLNEVPVVEVDAELQQRLSDALGRIVACYEGADLPPAVQQLRALVDRRDYDGLRDAITDVWNGLLGFHHQRGIRPHHQVTHAFNVIHGLVQT